MLAVKNEDGMKTLLLVTLSINSVLMSANWKTQRAEVVFRRNPNGEFDGELVALHFR